MDGRPDGRAVGRGALTGGGVECALAFKSLRPLSTQLEVDLKGRRAGFGGYFRGLTSGRAPLYRHQVNL
jgi:hypothetical protein